MAKAGYIAKTAAAVALVAATAKTVLNVIAPAQFGTDLIQIKLAFDGVTASAVPVYVEICSSTQAGAGTSTGATLNQVYGRSIVTGFTAQYNYTAEPTVLTSIDELPLVDPNKGLFVYDWPWGTTPDCAVSAGLCLRMTAPAAVNVRAAMKFERC